MKLKGITIKILIFLMPTALLADPLFSEDTSMQQKDAATDRLALSSQKRALEKLNKILKKAKGSKRAQILYKTALVSQEASRLYIRLAYHNGDKPSEEFLRQGTNLNAASIQLLTELITKHSRSKRLSDAYLLRADAYVTQNRKPLAIKDLQEIVRLFPKKKTTTEARLLLGDLLIEAHAYTLAIEALKPIKLQKSDPSYPKYLSILSWAYANNGNAEDAVAISSSLVKYFRSNPNSPFGNYKKSLLDYSYFYGKAIEKKADNFTARLAVPQFKKIGFNHYESMILNLASFLKSRRLHKQLESLKSIVLFTDIDKQIALKILNVTIENQIKNSRFEDLSKSIEDLKQVYSKHKIGTKSDDLGESRKLLLQAAEAAQYRMQKFKNSKGQSESQIDRFSKSAVEAYETYIAIAAQHDPDVPKVLYNIAELQYGLKKYELATLSYKRVATHPDTDRDLREKVQFSLIRSRYDFLLASKIIQEKVDPSAFGSEKIGSLPDKLIEWIQWIDSFPNKKNEDWHYYAYQANRTIYLSHQLRLAIKRLHHYVVQFPNSKYSIPSASLVIDTYIKSQNWDQAKRLSEKYAQLGVGKKQGFEKQLDSLRVSAAIKSIEDASSKGNHALVISKVEEFAKAYPNHSSLAILFAYASQAAEAAGNQALANEYLAKVALHGRNSEAGRAALIAIASKQEADLNFSGAVERYASFLSSNPPMSNSQLTSIKERAIYLGWISGSPTLLIKSLRNPKICSGTTLDLCNAYKGYGDLQRFGNSIPKSVALGAAVAALRSTRPEKTLLLTTLAIQSPHQLPFEKKFELLSSLKKAYSDSDQTHIYSVAPYLARSIPLTLSGSRNYIEKIAPLRMDKAAISRRVLLIQKFETGVNQVLSMPLPNVKPIALLELSKIYDGFAEEMQSLSPPSSFNPAQLEAFKAALKKQSLPFKQKSDAYLRQAFELAQKNNAYSTEIEELQSIYFERFPDQIALKPYPEAPKPTPLDERLISEFEQGSKTENKVLDLWPEYLKTKNYPGIAHLLGLMKKNNLVTKEEFQLRLVVSLNAVQNTSAALSEFRTFTYLSKENEIRKNSILLSHYLVSMNLSASQQLVVIMKHELKNKEEFKLKNDWDSVFFVYAARWSKNPLTEDERDAILDDIDSDSPVMQQRWAENIEDDDANRFPASGGEK